MVSVVLLVIACSLFIYKAFKYATHRPENFPPGPPRIPLVGSYFFLLLMEYKNIHELMVKLSRFYKSSMIGFYVGGDAKVVVVNDHKLVKEVLVRPEFDGRNDFIVARLRDPNYELNGKLRWIN
jgi:hypothetical protein